MMNMILVNASEDIGNCLTSFVVSKKTNYTLYFLGHEVNIVTFGMFETNLDWCVQSGKQDSLVSYKLYAVL